MHLVSKLALSVVVAAGFAGAASAHNHITVDTAGGAAGDPIVIRAGYNPTESAFTIVDRRLLSSGVCATYDVSEPLPQSGLLNNWNAADEILLTSDFYLASGRLNGGDFRYELAGIVVVAGVHGALAWGEFDGGGSLVPSAFSNGVDRESRSYDTNIGGHAHGQGFAFDAPGVYDVTFVAWDGNGRYADSTPVKIRFRVGEACIADTDGSGVVTIDDIFVYLNRWFAGSPAADFDGVGGVTIDDIFVFLNAWFTHCG